MYYIYLIMHSWIALVSLIIWDIRFVDGEYVPNRYLMLRLRPLLRTLTQHMTMTSGEAHTDLIGGQVTLRGRRQVLADFMHWGFLPLVRLFFTEIWSDFVYICFFLCLSLSTCLLCVGIYGPVEELTLRKRLGSIIGKRTRPRVRGYDVSSSILPGFPGSWNDEESSKPPHDWYHAALTGIWGQLG